MMDENQVLELVEFYEDMIEKQDEIIVRQSRFIKSLATELSHLRNMLNVEASFLLPCSSETHRRSG